MKLNQFHNIIKIISLLLYLAILNAGGHVPNGNEDNIKLMISGKEITYYELDDKLIYDNIVKQYKMGDSIQVSIYSRTIMASTGKKNKKYGFTVQINDDEPIQLYYNEGSSDVTSSERPGWTYSTSGIWHLYLPIQENGYKIKINQIDRKPVIYLRLTSNRIKNNGRFTEVIKTVNHQNRTTIETKRNNSSKKEPINTLWYLLDASNQQQFEIRGPATIRIFSRLLFNSNQQKEDYHILVKEDGIDLGTYYLITEKSNESIVVNSQKNVSKWRSIWLTIPDGKHYYTLSLSNIKTNQDPTVFIRLKEWVQE